MITEDTPAFPMNVILAMYDSLAAIDPEVQVYKRPLRSTDTVQAIGVFPTDWNPTPDSQEMGKPLMGGGSWGEQFATLNEYNVTIQSLVTDTDEERGIAVHSALATRIRATVARNQPLQLALGSLTSIVSGHQESFRRGEVKRQRYLTAELSGTWLYMSVTQYWFQTESR